MALNESFDRFLAALDDAIRWVESLGLRVRLGRFGEYGRFYQELLRSVRDNDSSVLLNEDWAQRALDGLVAGQELILIRRHLSHMPEDQLMPRLRKFVAGASLESSENPATRTSEARDVGFELVLAARLAEGGIAPELPKDGDLAVEAARLPIHIECKRPQSMAGLDKAVRKAADQLAARAKKTQLDPRGVIAISVGKMIHEGRRLIVARTPAEAQDVLCREASAFVRANDRRWQRDDWPFVHLALADISAPVHVTAPDQWLWGQFSVLNPKWRIDLEEPWVRHLRTGFETSSGISGF